MPTGKEDGRRQDAHAQGAECRERKHGQGCRVVTDTTDGTSGAPRPLGSDSRGQSDKQGAEHESTRDPQGSLRWAHNDNLG